MKSYKDQILPKHLLSPRIDHFRANKPTPQPHITPTSMRSDLISIGFNELKDMGFSILSSLNRIKESGDRRKNYMIIATKDWPKIQEDRQLSPILLSSGYPEFVEVFYRRLGGDMVKFYIYQQDAPGRKELSWSSGSPQRVRL